ncbi:MAG TPA: glycosyltransferase family 1 protein, partial [Thermodesulfobacteriota bacterium]|nr:glycosyltransferase family 1 protein [Thermodesulfobacteriota bacterium]
NSSTSIGLLAQGGHSWIAGVHYIHNIISALNLLTDDELPQLYLIMNNGNKFKEHNELNTNLPALRYYAYRKDSSFRGQLAAIRRSFQNLKWPRSLECIAARINAKAIFPSQISLGRHFPVHWVGWIPDFQHKRLPQFFSQEERLYRDRTYRKLLQEANHIVVSSQDAYKDLMCLFPIKPSKVSIFQFRSVLLPNLYKDDPRRIALSYGLPTKYLIYPSQFWIHKNHRLVIEAIRILRDSGFPDITLVCTGYKHDYRHPEYFDSLHDFILQNNLKRNIRILGLLPRNIQIQLLRGAAAVIQASVFEGWSMLVEESRALGKRIYLTDIPIHREQDPPDAFFFSLDSPEQLAELIAKDWAHLEPGPDLNREQQAYEVQTKLNEDFARTFLQIIDRACI